MSVTSCSTTNWPSIKPLSSFEPYRNMTLKKPALLNKMNSIEDIYNQAINHRGSMKIPMNFGDSVINYGVKIQKFISKTEIATINSNKITSFNY